VQNICGVGRCRERLLEEEREACAGAASEEAVDASEERRERL
jgi:hypothetical protein